MRGKKKGTPGEPVPPRDNGLPPKPEDLDDAKAALEASLPGANVFTDDAKLKVPEKSGGYKVHKRGVPKAGPAKFNHRGR